jgi:hypothetical protein
MQKGGYDNQRLEIFVEILLGSIPKAFMTHKLINSKIN